MQIINKIDQLITKLNNLKPELSNDSLINEKKFNALLKTSIESSNAVSAENLEIEISKNEYCFHAGTTKIENKIYASGGRVLNFVCLSENFAGARKKIINSITSLNWSNGFYRKDIGYKVIDE